jgi:hypothetical protein
VERRTLLYFSGTSGLSSDIMVRGLHYSHGVRQSVFLMFNDSARYPDFKVRMAQR